MAQSPQLTIALTPELEAFIRSRIESGRFDSAGDVVREGLELLETRERERDVAIAGIRREIAVGIQEANAGQLSDGEALFEELEREEQRPR